jgi:hypothetical protein
MFARVDLAVHLPSPTVVCRLPKGVGFTRQARDASGFSPSVGFTPWLFLLGVSLMVHRAPGRTSALVLRGAALHTDESAGLAERVVSGGSPSFPNPCPTCAVCAGEAKGARKLLHVPNARFPQRRFYAGEDLCWWPLVLLLKRMCHSRYGSAAPARASTLPHPAVAHSAQHGVLRGPVVYHHHLSGQATTSRA